MFIPRRALVGAAAILMASCGGGTSESPPSVTPPTLSAVPTLTRTVVLQGLSNPWDVAIASDGAMFFTEKCRGLSVRQGNGTVTRLFGTSGAALVAPDLVCDGQSGVHGVALDPSFATNRTLYVYMLSNLSTPRANRVVRIVLGAGYRSAGSRTDIITDIPYKEVANGVGGAGAHSGGRVRFGPDGFLYVTTGDNHNGHRNVQGISFRPGTGQPFVAEHGPNHSDEVTPLVNGGNGGWDPQNRPSLSCPSSYCGYAGNATTMPMTDVARFRNPMAPSWSNNGASQGMGPVSFSLARSGRVEWPHGGGHHGRKPAHDSHARCGRHDDERRSGGAAGGSV